MKDLIDIHSHTIVSGHAYNTLYEMAKAASEKGLLLFGSTDHAPSLPGTCHEIYFMNFQDIPRELFGVQIVMGCELNIIDHKGTVDMSERTLSRIDYAIASIHELCYPVGNADANTAATIGAMENPRVHIIGHPDSGRVPLHYEELVLAAKKHHKLLEVNDSSLLPGSVRTGAFENYQTMLSLCKQHQVPVIVSSDAHVASRVGDHRLAHQLLQQMDFPEKLVVNHSLEMLAEYLPCLQGINKSLS